MGTIEERVAALEAEVARLATLVPAAGTAAGTAASGAGADQTRPARGDVFWALEALKRRLPTSGPGAVVYTGVVEAAPGERYEWQIGRDTTDLLDDDWSAYAETLTALAHPIRLLLLREILTGRRTAGALAEVEGLGTTGQLYHHLRQLVSAGWLRATGRGHYAVPPERVVPLLVTLAAARR